MEQDVQAKVGRPAGSVKTEYERGEQVIRLPQPGPGIFLIAHAGKVLEICASENVHRYARQNLFAHEKVLKAAIETGDVQFIVLYRQEEYEPLELNRVLKQLQLEALTEKHLS